MYMYNCHVCRKVLEFSVDKCMVSVVHSTSHFSGITSNLTSVQNVHFWELLEHILVFVGVQTPVR